ncbi:IgGFc-binding protein-like [Ostrea edulis]|uniref:IgGFc-binding protein-like n=1 Tax=Ostrea edulis TaxID=37623 RepID=UPI0024AEC7D8|nr:IgGFc-binding protein-like [Ostrea edulis]XP_056002656.1 IgGFc-binding protein-like [Ostrea edulis]XP_056002657.1 IgGFc-binding protein-like [Ostrea edulis]XP_056002658.1 IgGFc-binding protein-like [Ostrea edulis]
MKNHQDALRSLTIYITTDNTTEVNISSSPNLNPGIKSAVDNNVYITSNSKFTLPFHLACEYLKVEPKAVIIRTSELSTVTIFDSFYEYSNDGTLVIPTYKLSNQYLISTTEPYTTSPYYYSLFGIGTLSDRTDIKIKFKMVNTSRITLLGRTYNNGDVFSITLDRFETFQVNHTTDLSGTFITSTEPIAVFSGTRCNNLISISCSHMVTQLPPTTELDYQFIVPPFFHNSKTLIQVVTPTHNTVNITIGGRVSSWILNEREYKNMESNETAVIVSRQPVLVTGFGMGSSSSLYINPYMTVIHGVHQYLDFYKITVPSGYTENFLCIIIPAVSIDNLQINGLSRDHYNTVYQSSVYLDKAYDVHVLQVRNTGETFVLSTTDKSKFGLIVYGHRTFDGYGFSGNFVLP